MATKRMNRQTMGNDYGGRKAENPAGVSRVSREGVLSAAQTAGVQVKRESVRTGCVSAGWSMWWVLRPGDVWRTLATTNYQAAQELQKLNLN